MEIDILIYDHVKTDFRMNLKAYRVKLKTRYDTPNITNLNKCTNFVHSFMFGFDVVDVGINKLIPTI